MKKILRLLFVALFAVAITSCDKDSDQPNNPNGGTNKPGVSVPDPTGTVTLKMRNKDNGKTYLDDRNIYIDEGNNFCGATFVDVGKVAGLGNITSIPKVGWASNVAVNPGHGYVAYSYGIFYRIYVTEWTLTAGNLIIGAEVKYQKPFKGNKEAIKAKVTSLTFTAEGGSQTILFDNSSVIPFSIARESGDIFFGEGETWEDGPVPGYNWLTITKCSSTDYSFLMNGIFINVNPGNTTESQTVKLKLIAANGAVTPITITRSGVEPYIEITQEVEISNDLIATIPFSSNIPFENLSAKSNQNWLSASIEDESNLLEEYNAKTKCIGRERKMISRSAITAVGAHRLKLTASANYGTDRKAVVTVTGDGCTAKINVTQHPIDLFVDFINGDEQIIEPTEGNNSYGFRSSVPKEALKATSDASWLTIQQIDGEYDFDIKYNVTENKTNEVRVAHITVSSTLGDISKTLTIRQRPHYLDLSIGEVYFDRMTGVKTINITSTMPQITPKSDSEWCVFTLSNNVLSVMVTENTAGEERDAYITFEGFDAKLKVIQSKYAVGDRCSDYGVYATVYKMDGSERYVYYRLPEDYKWSTIENVTGANSETDGMYNTEIIHQIPSWKDFYPAFAKVDELNSNGITGWFMPAKMQMPFIKDRHWSSTEIDASSAIMYYFSYSYYYRGYTKTNSCYVFAIRKF